MTEEEEEKGRDRDIYKRVEQLSEGPMEGTKSLQPEDGVEELSSTIIPYIFTTLRHRSASSSTALPEAISQHDVTLPALYTTNFSLLLTRMTFIALICHIQLQNF